MSVGMQGDQRYQQARQRVVAIRGFYTHLLVFAVINAFLFLINLLTTPGTWWFIWPLLGWGACVMLHAVVALGAESWWGKEWEERKIHDLIDRDEPR